MVRAAIMLLVVLGLSLSVAPRVYAGDAESIQALEAQIKEAERAGITGPEVDFLRMMLKDLKKDAADSSSTGADARRMRPNYFDAQNVSWLGDCGQYDDRQAFAFCASARNAFQNYIQAFNAGAEDHQLDVFYAAHEKSANDLILYLGDERSSKTTAATPKAESPRDERPQEPSKEAKAIQIDEPASEPFERIRTDSDGGSMTTTSKGRVYEPQPETRTGEKAWFSDRDDAIANARLQAAIDIDDACRAKGARSDRPYYRNIAGGDSPPPRWSYAAPDCVQGGWKDEEWKCRATVSGHCYWE